MRTNAGAWSSLVVSGVLAGAAACSSPTGGLKGDPDLADTAENAAFRYETGVYLLTQLDDLEVYPEALFVGRVEVDGAGCVRLAGWEEEPTTALWPKGFTARKAGSAVEFVDRDGKVVGRTGAPIRFAGGIMPYLHEGLGFTTADQERAASRCPGNVWLVAPGTVVSD